MVVPSLICPTSSHIAFEPLEKIRHANRDKAMMEDIVVKYKQQSAEITENTLDSVCCAM
jgi:hypothetical protein